MRLIPLFLLLAATLHAQSAKKNFFRQQQSAYQVLAPTGHSLKGGEILYTNGMIVLNSVHFGLTDHISISTMPTLWSLFDSWTPMGLMVQPQVSFPLAKHLKMGGYFLANIPLEKRLENAEFIGFIDNQPRFRNQSFSGLDGLMMGYLTVGTSNHFLTVGHGRFVEEDAIQPEPVWQVSIGLRYGPRGWLMMENYFTDGRFEDFILDDSLGFLYGRFVTYKGHAFEYGVTLLYNWGGVVPYLGFSVPVRRLNR